MHPGKRNRIDEFVVSLDTTNTWQCSNSMLTFKLRCYYRYYHCYHLDLANGGSFHSLAEDNSVKEEDLDPLRQAGLRQQ